MCDGEKGDWPEMDTLDAGTGIEHRVEDEVPALVHAKAERPTGKEFHNIDRAMLIRLGPGRRRARQARLRYGGNRKKDRKNRGHAEASATAEYGIHVALRSLSAALRIGGLECWKPSRSF